MGVYAMLAAASAPSVHQLQRSLLTTLTHAPCSSTPSSSLSTISRLPCLFRDDRGTWLTQPSLQTWKTWLTCWPRRRRLVEDLPALARAGHGSSTFSCNASTRGKIIAGAMTGSGDDEGKPNGAVATGPYQVKEDKQSKLHQFAPSTEMSHSNDGELSVDHEVPLQTHRGWVSPVDMRKQIFCNRSLNMKSIVAVGFDMDYTLAQYKPDTFESLAYTSTIHKLVHDLGYPSELLQWKFDWRYMVRGLVLDKQRGCILKMDRHKYVKVAYHGFRELSREERHATYCNTLSRESFDEPDYGLIDTLFSLAEAYLFMQLVDFRDAFPDSIPSGTEVQCEDGSNSKPNYAQMYRDVRAAVDLCHRDGTLKQAVAQDPQKYINEDLQIFPMLKMLRQSGRMTFLVTNSLWDYTHVVMNYLSGKCGTDGGIPRDDEWLSYFDLVITGSTKPTFFMDGNRAPLFEVDIGSGMLRNTDQGTPHAQIGEIGLNTPGFPQKNVKQACRVFQGGSVAHLHRLLAIEAGAQVLYVGDHIYGDILRSKKQLGWRTMLVVPELETELEMLSQTSALRKEFQRLRRIRDVLEDTLQRREWALKFDDHTEEERQRLGDEIDQLQRERDKVREKHRQAQRECHQRFHSTWGQLMKTGYQNSRFSHQVERFACLYTSHVSNLCCYSPDKSYRTSEDFMPHELEDTSL